MKKLFMVFTIFLFSYSCLRGDDPVRVGKNYINVFQQGFVLESLSGYGFSSTAYSPVFNVGSGNPASISVFNQFSAGFSHQVNTKIKSFGIPGASIQRVNNLIPQSVGLVYPMQNFRFGAGYSQKYSAEIRLEDIPVTTVQNPDGTGEYYTAIFENAIHSISTLGSYQLNNLLSQADQLSIGVQLNMNLLRNRESIWRTKAELKDEAVNWKFGLGYTYHHQSIEKLQFGIAYESKINFSGYYEYNRTLSIPPNATEPVQIPSTLTYPANMKFRFLFEPTSKVGIYNDFIYNFWDDIHPNNKNKLDLSGGIILDASDLISISLGYYKLESYANDINGNAINTNDAVYISAGLILGYKLLDIHLVVADSHLFSEFRRKQTIGKVGVGFNL